jgi:hypothetical protein
MSKKFESERGQAIVILAFAMIAFIAAAGAAIDAGMIYWQKSRLDEISAIAACDAAEAYSRGESTSIAFFNSLQANGVSGSVVDTFSVSAGSVWVQLSDQTPAYFLSIVGIRDFDISGRARCLIPEATFTPIAVRRSAVEHSLSGGNPESYEILGSSPKWDLADTESGDNYRGAVFMHMLCVDPRGDGITNCPEVQVWDPLTSPPANSQTVKDLAKQCFYGTNCNIRHPVGSHLPIISGTSNKFLVDAFCDSTGCAPGQLVVVMIFDGEVYSPDPGFGNWENVKVIGYAVYEIVDADTNTVKAKLHSGPFDSLGGLDVEIDAREIPWTYGHGG